MTKTVNEEFSAVSLGNSIAERRTSKHDAKNQLEISPKTSEDKNSKTIGESGHNFLWSVASLGGDRAGNVFGS